MMLAASAILTSATQAVAAVFSPTACTCKKRVAPTRYRYEPYSAQVIPREWYVETAPVVAIDPSIAMSVPIPSLAETCSSLQSLRTAPVIPCAAPIDSAILPPQQQQPVSKSVAPSGPRYAIIAFKHETVTFLAPFRISVGDTVVVEGDRGENIGTVREIRLETPAFDVTNKVLRRATEKDYESLSLQREREDEVVRVTQQLADNFGLHATIEDAEYQFDLNKLTIFVRRSSSKSFVDFRKLQRSLFREFRCRIWCAYMDEVEAAESGPRTR
jgi:hypothetical protein